MPVALHTTTTRITRITRREQYDREWQRMVDELSRRGFLQGIGAAGALLGLAACGSGSGNGSNHKDAGAGDAFRYTDARGQAIDLAKRPTRVVAQSSAAASLWDVGFHVDGVYGELRATNGQLDYQAGSIDLGKVTVIGKTYGEFNIEQYAALRPQLLIDLCYVGKDLWYVPADEAAKIYSLAPSLGVPMRNQAVPQVIAEFMKLAAALGADPATPEIRSAQADYDAAVAAIKSAARPDVRVVAISRAADKLWVCDPRQTSDLKHLLSLGVNIVGPHAKPDAYFDQLSWEQIGRYPADVILYDAREAPNVTAAAAKMPTWTGLPAVKAGQVYPWRPAAPFSYKSYAPLYRAIAQHLREARVVAPAS
jgi:iron complex transport system substrate-binding protein